MARAACVHTGQPRLKAECTLAQLQRVLYSYTSNCLSIKHEHTDPLSRRKPLAGRVLVSLGRGWRSYTGAGGWDTLPAPAKCCSASSVHQRPEWRGRCCPPERPSPACDPGQSASPGQGRGPQSGHGVRSVTLDSLCLLGRGGDHS